MNSSGAIRGRSALRALAIGLTCGLLIAIPAARASAFSFAGVEHVEAATQFRVGASKSITAKCPAGKRLISAGGSVRLSPFTVGVNPHNNALIEGIVPNPGLTAVTVAARRYGGSSTSPWSVRAHAICAIVPEANQLQLVPSPGDDDLTSVKETTAECPPGKRVTGTGAATAGAPGAVVIEAISPDPGLTRVTVRAAEVEGGAAAWGTTAYAVCALPSKRTALTGLELRSNTAPTQSPYTGWSRACPPGKRLIGLGGGVADLNGLHGEVVISVLAPHSTTDGEPPNGVFVYGGREYDFQYEWWTITTHAICDYPPQSIGAAL